MLTFYRHFVFPRLHGYSPPAVDWNAARGALVEQLTAAEGEASRVFLERELWSYRQAYASAGRTDLASKLGWVRYRVFPQSEFRNDIFFTATSGHYPVIPPVPSAASFVWVARGIALWFMLVMVAVLWMAFRVMRDKHISVWQKALWLLATLIMGPVSLLAHVLIGRKLDNTPLPPWKQALGASLFCISGYAVAWTLAILVLMRSPDEPHPLLLLGLCYFMPLLLGLLLVRGPLLMQGKQVRFGRAISQGLPAEIITVNLSFAVLFPLTMFANQYLFTAMPHPSNPYFWGLMSFISIVGALVLFPLHYWMARRNWTVLQIRRASRDVVLALPTLQNAWGALLMTLGIMIATLALTVSQLA